MHPSSVTASVALSSSPSPYQLSLCQPAAHLCDAGVLPGLQVVPDKVQVAGLLGKQLGQHKGREGGGVEGAREGGNDVWASKQQGWTTGSRRLEPARDKVAARDRQLTEWIHFLSPFHVPAAAAGHARPPASFQAAGSRLACLLGGDLVCRIICGADVFGEAA